VDAGGFRDGIHVEHLDRVLTPIAGEVAAVTVDHRQARAHVAPCGHKLLDLLWRMAPMGLLLDLATKPVHDVLAHEIVVRLAR
jgi:hypothetical protein